VEATLHEENDLRRLGKHFLRIAATLLLGGLLGATLVRFAPGFGVDESELDSRLNNASIHALREQNQPQRNLLAFYADYLWRLAHGDLGTSRLFQRPISELLRERIPDSAKSIALGLALGWTLGMGMALLTVMPCSWSADFVSSVFAGMLLCLPAAVLSLLFVLARAPVRLVLAFIVFPNVFRYARNLLQHSARQPHVLMAHAKGLSHTRVLLWHILKPIAPQLLALAGVSVSAALTAAIPVEALCDLPGIGQLAWKAALGRDLNLLVDLTMIVTVVTLFANSVAEFLPQHRSATA
jgi:peptide/nickel transport system permease protein